LGFCPARTASVENLIVDGCCDRKTEVKKFPTGLLLIPTKYIFLLYIHEFSLQVGKIKAEENFLNRKIFHVNEVLRNGKNRQKRLILFITDNRFIR
jgi:hypothetical protein